MVGAWRTALVGAGQRAAGLMRHLTAAAGFEVVAVVEPVPERLHEIADRFRIPHAFGSVRELTSAGMAIDCAFVVTPPWLHADVFAACASAGWNVFCEKPMDMELAAAERMMRAVRETGIRAMFGFNRRYTPAARLARALCAGRPPAFVHTSKSRPMSYSRMLAENAVHAVDLLLWISGSVPRRVRSVASFQDEAIEAEAYVAASLEFVSGGAGSFQMVTSGMGAVERLEVYGEQFTLLADLPHDFRYAGDAGRLSEAAASQQLRLEQGAGGRFQVTQERSDVAEELSAFSAALRGEARDVPDAQAAFEAQRLVEAIYAGAGLPPTRRSERWVRES